MTKPIPRWEQIIIALATAAAVAGFSTVLWAGDREHVGGPTTSPGARDAARERSRHEHNVAASADAINDDGTINHAKLGAYLDRIRKNQNPTTYHLRGTYSFWTGWGPYSIFSRDFWTNPRSSVGPGTFYEGGAQRDGLLGGPGIGSWGQGGGTGPGARGY